MTNKGKKPTRPPFPLFKTFPSTIERTGYKLYNYLDNTLYPIRPFYFGISVAASLAFYTRWNERGLMAIVPKIGQGPIAEYGRLGLVSLTTSYIPVFISRFILRHFYFSYKRWLFENPKKPSLATKIWGIIRSVLNLVPPRLKSCDDLLPTMPVPPLQQTIDRYLESIKQLHSEEQLESIKKMADDFLKGEGKKLQRYAWFYSLFVDNYVTGFWEKYAYLFGRESLMINSSVAHVDIFKSIPATQAVRAAHIVYIESLSALAIDRQTYPPLGNGIVCARHYDRMYSVTRIPGEKMDELKNYGITRHVVVLYNGRIYKVNVVDEKDRIYNVDQLSEIFFELLSRKDAKVEGAAGMIPALTFDKRTTWAMNRKRFFVDIPKNAKALDVIESALFILDLDSAEDWEYVPEKPEVLSKYLRAQLTGNGYNRWVDKSLNYIVSKNARCGGTTEHSIGDGSEFDHIMENFLLMDTAILEYAPLEEQINLEKNFSASKAYDRGVRFAKQLDIDVSPEMESEITRAYNTYCVSRDDVDLDCLIYREWGKGKIKQFGVSPDAFLQMAIQYANYKDQKKFVLTYEAASSRFYKNSRTETLRSVTDESCEFVRSMNDPSIDNSTRISLLKKAAELHSSNNRECMVNKGVDRHLFVLYVLSQGTGISSPFLNHYIQQEWLLSTSHVPNVTNTMKEDEDPDKSWLGACFGAVAKTGYGVCYRFAGNHSICVHISSYHSAENTNSARFRSNLEEALVEMSALFE